MYGATRSASPITDEMPMKMTRGRYSCSSAFIITTSLRPTPVQSNLHPGAHLKGRSAMLAVPGLSGRHDSIRGILVRSGGWEQRRLSAAHKGWQVDVRAISPGV